MRFGFFAVSPNGDSVAVQLGAGGTVVYSLEGGDGVPVPGLDEQPIRWSADGRFLFTYRFGQMPMEVLRVEVATGAAETIASLIPAEAAGVVVISPFAVAPEVGAYVYGYLRHLSELLVAEGME